MEKDLHVGLIGPTGTAKTICVKDCLNNIYDNTEYGNIIINFSGQTKAGNIQDEIEAKISRKRRKGHYGPDNGLKKVVIFVDDMNMPQKEEYGA